MSLAGKTLRLADPGPRPWTFDEFRVMGDLGFFRGQRVDLIDGVVYEHGRGSKPTPRRWTVDEYQAMADRGLFEGQQVELIGGEVLVMSPQSPRHYATLETIAEVLRGVFPRHWVRTQAPLDFGIEVQPEPDVSVVEGSADQYLDRHPSGAMLVVEVSQTTLPFDRHQKAGLYARAGVPEYWVVDLTGRRVEVHRGPTVDPTHPFGARYADVNVVAVGQAITPLAVPLARVELAWLLP
jgi:Uma2 family endonuclease